MVNQLEVGDMAPDFILPDVELERRSLKEFLGKKVVLAFLLALLLQRAPSMCVPRFHGKDIDLNAQVVGISVNDPFSNRAFAEKNRLPFPVLSDYKRDVIKQRGLELFDFAGLVGYIVAKHSIFILDETGIFRYVWVSEDPSIEPNYDEIQRPLNKSLSQGKYLM